MYYKCHKVCIIRGGSYIDSADWIKKKKATINPKNTDDKCFLYAVTIALNYEEIESHPERVWSIKTFINKYNWEEINYPSKIDDWKNVWEKIIRQLLLIFCIPKKKKYVQLISQNVFGIAKKNVLMIPNEEKEGWHYLAVKKLSTPLRGVASKHHGDFYCLNCLHSFRK